MRCCSVVRSQQSAGEPHKTRAKERRVEGMRIPRYRVLLGRKGQPYVQVEHRQGGGGGQGVGKVQRCRAGVSAGGGRQQRHLQKNSGRGRQAAGSSCARRGSSPGAAPREPWHVGNAALRIPAAAERRTVKRARPCVPASARKNRRDSVRTAPCADGA